MEGTSSDTGYGDPVEEEFERLDRKRTGDCVLYNSLGPMPTDIKDYSIVDHEYCLRSFLSEAEMLAIARLQNRVSPDKEMLERQKGLEIRIESHLDLILENLQELSKFKSRQEALSDNLYNGKTASSN